MARKVDTPDPVARVRTLLEQLNLTTAARQLAELLTQAETTQPAYSAFLHQILEAEDGARWERKLQRRRRWSSSARQSPSTASTGPPARSSPRRSSRNSSRVASSRSTGT